MSDPARRMSIVESYSGKHVLLTGGSGFLGKVWLSMLLTHVPEIGKIYVFMRPKALVSGQQRFQNMLNTSQAFKPLHDRFGDDLSAFLATRLEVVEGNLESPGLGFSPELTKRLQGKLDLVIHCAGLVDFNPDLARALSANVESTRYVADFVEGCDDAALVHISTCYVAGNRSGLIPEKLVPNYVPNGDVKDYDAVEELEEALSHAQKIRAECATDRVRREVERETDDLLANRREGKPSARLRENLIRRGLRERLKKALCDAGMDRARKLGFPNTYTYSKSMAESLLKRREGKLRYTIYRPTIVESALRFPFTGWNESFNGSAPLAYVMASWFRAVPARPDAPFDVIPVDLVSCSMTIAGAAVMENRHAEVYQIGTSHRHRCSVGRAAELITLAHRQYHRKRERSRTDRILKSRWDANLVDRDHLLGVEVMRDVTHGALEMLDLLPAKVRRKFRRFENRVNDVDGKLADIEHMVTLYMPFMYENYYVFESKSVSAFDVVEEPFRFEPETQIDWRDYWLNVHIPGLRRWAFPLIEGRRPERYRAPCRVTLPPPAPAQTTETKIPASAAAPAMGEG